jgi:outer membrane murein-binding lipoprotein Lpp
MKKNKNIISAIIIAAMLVTGCSKDKKELSQTDDQARVEKVATLEMNKDSLDTKVIDDLKEQIVKRKIELTTEALSVIGETHSLLQEISKSKKNEAIKKGKELIGSLEILLAKDPELSLIPVDVDFRKNELITDVETVRKTAKLAQEAMDKGYYQLAADLLEGIRSEMVINTYLIPTATYPEAIKLAVIDLEADKPEEAKRVLQNVLSTVVIDETVLPLPVLNAEQMIIEASKIDAKDHENSDKVINLLKNAEYQLSLAEEMGYGKKDKDFKTLSESIKALKKSVEKKEDSGSRFDSLKQDIRKFQERLFSSKK